VISLFSKLKKKLKGTTFWNSVSHPKGIRSGTRQHYGEMTSTVLLWKKLWGRCLCSEGDYSEGDGSQNWVRKRHHFFFDLVQELSYTPCMCNSSGVYKILLHSAFVEETVGSLSVFRRRLFWARLQPKLSTLRQHFFFDLVRELACVVGQMCMKFFWRTCRQPRCCYSRCSAADSSSWLWP
jgi:hypothetical protein